MSNIHGLNAANRAGAGGAGFGGFGGGGGGEPTSCKDKMKKCWASIPLFNKFVLSTCSIIYLLSWISNMVVMFTILIPGFIMQFQVWRLITGPFVHTSIINLLFSALSYVPSAMMEEEQMGTVLMTLRFFKLSLFINVIFSLLAILIGMVFGVKQLLMEPAMGLWPIIMCDIVIQCYQQPDMPRGLCCLPVQIPSKWYPLVLIAIFTIFFGPQFSLFAGMGAGYLYVFGYLKCLETSAPSLRSWEERWPFKGLQTNPSFKKSQTALVSAPRQGGANRSQSQGSFATSFMGGGNQSSTSTQANTGAAPSRPADEESKSSFKAFKGKGVSLGSDDNASRQTRATTPQPQKEEAKTAPPISNDQKQQRLMALAKQREERQKPEEGADLETVDLIDIEETNTATKPSKDDKGDYKAVDNNTNYQL